MGIKFGEIDATQILDNEFKIMVLERIVDKLLLATPGVAISIESIRKEVVAQIQKKYPNSGIEYKG